MYFAKWADIFELSKNNSHRKKEQQHERKCFAGRRSWVAEYWPPRGICKVMGSISSTMKKQESKEKEEYKKRKKQKNRDEKGKWVSGRKVSACWPTPCVVILGHSVRVTLFLSEGKVCTGKQIYVLYFAKQKSYVSTEDRLSLLL